MEKEEIGFCPICSGVGEEAVSEILGFAKKMSFESGQYIYLQDENYTGIYVVLEGEVCLTAQNEQGKEFLVNRYVSGEVFGESGLVYEKCLESARAVKPSVCVFLPKDKFTDLMSRNTSLSASIISLLGAWIVEFHGRFQTLSFTNVRQRVEHYFESEVKKTKNSILALKLKRHEMASNLGIRPETLSRILSDLQKDGLIKISSKNVVDLSNFNPLTK